MGFKCKEFTPEYSQFQLLSALEGKTCTQIIANNLNDYHAARKSFIATEARSRHSNQTRSNISCKHETIHENVHSSSTNANNKREPNKNDKELQINGSKIFLIKVVIKLKTKTKMETTT